MWGGDVKELELTVSEVRECFIDIYLQKHFLSNILLYQISKCFPQISIFFFLLHFIFHAFEASLDDVLFQMDP